MARGNTEPTPEQLRNRARVYVVGRVIAGLCAVTIAVTVYDGLRDGYFRLGVGDSRGPTRDYVVLDTPVGMMLGSMLLQSMALWLGLIAVAPRYAFRTRFLLSTLATALIASILVGVLYR